MRIFASFVFLPILFEGTFAYVYSCPEVDYRFINTNLTVPSRYVCLYLEQEYIKGATFDKIYMHDGENLTSFTELIGTCIESTSEEPWSIIGDEGFTTNCGANSDFALIFTSSVPDIVQVTSQALTRVGTKEQIVVSPDSGTSIHKKSCTGAGRVTFYTGTGIDEEEQRFEMKSWRCSDLPDWIITFDNVFTIVPDDNVELSLDYQAYDWRGAIMVEPSQSWAVMTSGRSDNAYQYEFATERTIAALEIDVVGLRNFIYGTVTCENSFDDQYRGFVYMNILTNATRPPNFIKKLFSNGTTTWSGFAQSYNVYFEIKHTLQEDQVWDSQDTYVCEYTPGPAITTTLPPIDEESTTVHSTTSTAASISATGSTPSSSQSTTSAASGWKGYSLAILLLVCHLFIDKA